MLKILRDQFLETLPNSTGTFKAKDQGRGHPEPRPFSWFFAHALKLGDEAEPRRAFFNDATSIPWPSEASTPIKATNGPSVACGSIVLTLVCCFAGLRYLSVVLAGSAQCKVCMAREVG